MRNLTQKTIVAMALMVLFMAGMLPVHSEAMMGPPGGGGGGMDGSMWGNNDSWMLKGILRAPVVGNDGTAYIVNYAKTDSGMISRIRAVELDGTNTTVSLRGKVSLPVAEGVYLFATTSSPVMSDYHVTFNHGTNPAGEQSVLFRLPAPFGSNAVPDAAALDGRIASMPVVSSNRIYVTTNDVYYAKKYLYVLNPDLTLVAKSLIQ